MTVISLIVAIDSAWGIGKNNQLLCHLPADLSYFKDKTLGKPIIMGRNTFESIGKALPGRVNIVMSRHTVHCDGVISAKTLKEALLLAGPVAEVMIIGGRSIYEQALPLVHRIYLTRIENQFDADTFFPHIDLTGWECREEMFRVADEKNPYNLQFCRYEKKRKTS